jgi:hypothetical protein
MLPISAGSHAHQTWEFLLELIGNSDELVTGGWTRFEFEHEIAMESR